MVAFRKVAFSSRKAALAAKKEANCCWWDSCWSFNIRSNASNCCSNVGSELEWGISPIEPFDNKFPVVFAAVWRSEDVFGSHKERQWKELGFLPK